MFRVMMIVDGIEYVYGTYSDRDHANDVALWISYERDIDTYVIEV